MALGVNVAIGSDHASSGIVDMTQEVRLACCCYKEMRLNPRVMPPETGIEMATINGAKALGLGDVTGSITVGKRADLILIRTTDVNIAPLANIETTIVQSATPENVDTVMVDGRIVKRGGRLVGYDVPGIVARAKDSARRIRTKAGGILAPVCDACGNPVRRVHSH